MSQKIHRKELKHDEIGEKFGDAVRSLSLHGKEILYIVAIALAILAIIGAWYYYEQTQEQASQAMLGTAIKKFTAPVIENKSDPALAGVEYSYKTDAEKYAAARQDFEQIAKNYGHTSAGESARYYAGICAFYLKDNSQAEQYLMDATHVSEKNILYYRTRMTLADLYSRTGKSDQAIALVQDAIDHNKDIVPQETLLMQLAQLYKGAGKKTEAIATYQKIIDTYKDSPISYKAQIEVSELKK
ncbi:MAG TPA: tetratricopeptide repeat protein [Acidobacteriota bacterium]|nr:tetratricopeptide repeat protein [Acidobacteriota bacterium]